MYFCSNCGEGFEGRICPNCCTLRPAAAVIGETGKVLCGDEDISLAPGQRAVQFAEQLEYSRRQSARLQAELEEERRRVELEEQQKAREREYLRRAQKAASWEKKRVSNPDIDETVVVTDALRTLRIATEKPAQAENSGNSQKTAESFVQSIKGGKVNTRQRVSPPLNNRATTDGKCRTNSETACSEKIDAVWRMMAADRESGKQRKAVPAPPVPLRTPPKPPAPPKPKKN